MPDLIIKPTNTSGNKVIIQDQAGGAVLTTADSGATIANATLTSPTLVTPALGTVATGNLSNTAIVYRQGHVLQVQSAEGTPGVGNATSTLEEVGTPNPSLTTTVLNSKIFIQGCANVHSGTTNFLLRFQRIISGGATTTVPPSNTIVYRDLDDWTLQTPMYMDEPAQAAGTTISYKFMFANADNSTNVSFGASSGIVTLILFEIAP